MFVGSAPTHGSAHRSANKDPVALLITRLGDRMASGVHDVNIAAAGRLSGLKAHRGIVHFLRVGTWRMAAADAVDADARIGDEALGAALARSGAPWDEVDHVVGQYPVLGVPGDPEALKWRSLASAPAYPHLVRIIEDSMARAGTQPPGDPNDFNRLVAEGLRCSWMASCSAGTLATAARSPEGKPGLDEIGSLEEEDEELRRQAEDIERWCAEFFADRLVELHGLDPAVAVQLAFDFVAARRDRFVTAEQMFPPRSFRRRHASDNAAGGAVLPPMEPGRSRRGKPSYFSVRR